jgi:hypothetical protein
MSPDDYARQQASLWSNGLASWGQDGARIRRLREAADFAIYTPGSDAGLPVSVLKSFGAPPAEILEDRELLRDRISATATALLALLGIEADPIQSREHILLSNILDTAWRNGQDLDLAALIQQIQSPPMTRVGVLDLEAFFPAKDRFSLAMSLNNLLASPGFEAWLEGDALDIGRLLHTPEGKPRVSIFSIAHLSDAERMFFVSLLLNQTVSWMRTQSGTTSLRAIVYMDEIFGFFPPVANPPSKLPLLTLLKQARAFGVGVVLATQNPVDLDYKGLSNAGTWFIGRLQTERDKMRMLDGLEGASAGAGARFDRARTEEILAGLGNRVFLLNNVHEDAPEIFETRWALSYLRGPLTRGQIKELMRARKAGAAAASDAAQPAPARPSAAPVTEASVRPVLPPDIPEYFLPARGGAGTLVYRPVLLGAAQVRFVDAKAGVDVSRDVTVAAPLRDQPVAVDWSEACPIDCGMDELERNAEEIAKFVPLPPAAAKAKNYAAWNKEFTGWLFANEKVELFYCTELKLTSAAGESEGDFRVRLAEAVRETRDQAVEKLRQKYAPKIATLQGRIRRAEQVVQRESEQAQEQKVNTMLSVGTSLLGALFGRKVLSTATLGRATTAARSVGRSRRESQDVARASENLEAMKQQLADLDAAFRAETEALAARIDATTAKLETTSVRPKRTNIAVRLVALAWSPEWVG